MMTREHVVWAGAIWVEKHYGDDGGQFIATRIGSLVLEDDIVGVEMWEKIAAAFVQLHPVSDAHH